MALQEKETLVVHQAEHVHSIAARMKGLPITLNVYETRGAVTNKHFQQYALPDFEKIYLPESIRPFTIQAPSASKDFLVDDNRGAVAPTSSMRIDGTDFYLSVKGIGSTTNPFSHRLFTKSEICTLVKDSNLKEKIINSEDKIPRYLTGELWLRGSPYGAQGLQHATASMRASEMANPTSIHGFRIAPIVRINLLPEDLEQQIKQLYWYRRFAGRIVQETRLVPSNIRVYFHSGTTIGGTTSYVFDQFGIDTNEKALAFLENFIKSGIAYLTLFTRSIVNNDNGTYSGLDFYDVWLDKDAVLAPDGTIYFVDLEGLEWITINREKVHEKIDDQIYRSLYEFMYAYEQIERERERRFGGMHDRKLQLEYLLREALKDDEVVDLEHAGQSLELVINNILHEPSLVHKFPIIDR